MSATAENLPAVATPVNEPTRTLSPFAASESSFALAQRQAIALCQSTLVPAQYRGKENIGNVMIAMELANRIGASPLMVMQSLYIVSGKPSWSSSFLIATVNACGRFEPIRFEIIGEDPFHPDYRVRAYAKDKASGEICYGTWITWKMVRAEGWDGKTGSKWKTMPGQMFLYRGATFWTRLYAPEISLGIQSTEEVQDVWGGGHSLIEGGVNAPGSIESLKNSLIGQDSPNQTTGLSFDEVRGNLEAAGTRESLDDAADLIRDVPDSEERSKLNALYNARLAEIEPQ